MGSGEPSVFRNDGAAEVEFVVEADRHDRVGVVDGVRQNAVERIVAGKPAEVVVAILELADQVVGDGVSDTAAGGQAAALNRERIDGASGNGIGMRQAGGCPATVKEQQQAINRDTASRTKRAAVAKFGLVD